MKLIMQMPTISNDRTAGLVLSRSSRGGQAGRGRQCRPCLRSMSTGLVLTSLTCIGAIVLANVFEFLSGRAGDAARRSLSRKDVESGTMDRKQWSSFVGRQKCGPLHQRPAA